MVRLKDKKFLSLAGLTAIILAPLSLLGWNGNGSKNASLSSSGQLPQQTASVNDQAAAVNQPSTPSSNPSPSANNNTANHTTITINGQTVPLNPDGQTHLVLPNGSGTTTLDVSIQNSSSGNQAASQSTNSISFSSESNTTVNGQSAHN